MQFISFKFLNPPVIAPVEYSYQEESDRSIGDVVRVRCEEYPVPELTMLCKELSRPIMNKMFGRDVVMARAPFHFGLFGLELRGASDKKPWTEEAAFHLMLGVSGREVKIKTPFFGLFDTYQGSWPAGSDDINVDVLSADTTGTVRRLVDACMAYIGGERAQTVLEFDVDAEPEDVKNPQLPGFSAEKPSEA